jgi:hypothetical protein
MWTRAALVLTLALVALGCEDKKAPAPQEGQAPKAAGEFVPGMQEEEKADAGDARFEGAGAFLPRGGELDNKLEQGPEYYTRDTLFEIIDGASEGYIAYGMTQMAKAVYKPTKGDYQDEINVEIYKYEPALGALGKFAQERSSCEDGHPDNWCVRQSDLIIWKGPHMAKVQAFDDTPAGAAAILKVARAVEAKLPGEARVPAFLSQHMPAEGRVAGGAGWSPRDEFGFSGIGPVWMQDYKPAGDAYKAPEAKVVLFAAEKESPEAAKALFEDIKKRVQALDTVKKSGGVKPLKDAGEEGFWFDDGYGKHTVLRKGAVVAGGRDFQDEATAVGLTGKLASSL